MSGKEKKRKLFGKLKRRQCFYCGKKLVFDLATVDHVKPLSKGGSKENARITGVGDVLLQCCLADNGSNGKSSFPLLSIRLFIRDSYGNKINSRRFA